MLKSALLLAKVILASISFSLKLEGDDMGKSQDAKKETKKAPAKSAKEKKAEKQVKKASKD
ncbi:MAG: hypothetical protein H7318_00690 [Oligoflexus sp.]|nr:hypothetical protein [Oligoflexus sp.]